MEAKIATAGEALTASRYRVANFKLGERNTELAGNVKKKSDLNILIVRTDSFHIAKKFHSQQIGAGEL